jgi:hypothetical protein
LLDAIDALVKGTDEEATRQPSRIVGNRPAPVGHGQDLAFSSPAAVKFASSELLAALWRAHFGGHRQAMAHVAAVAGLAFAAGGVGGGIAVGGAGLGAVDSETAVRGWDGPLVDLDDELLSSPGKLTRAQHAAAAAAAAGPGAGGSGGAAGAPAAAPLSPGLPAALGAARLTSGRYGLGIDDEESGVAPLGRRRAAYDQDDEASYA